MMNKIIKVDFKNKRRTGIFNANRLLAWPIKSYIFILTVLLLSAIMPFMMELVSKWVF